jgi:glycosyltransferase involved in cell wall biosynthesis
VRIAFVHLPGRLARLEAARAGEAPTEFLFGALELERVGHDVAQFEVDPGREASRLAREVERQAGLGRFPPHLSGTVLAQTRGLLGDLRHYDVVVGSSTATAVALATWRRLGRLRTPLVGIVAGLFADTWRRSRRATTVPLLRRMHPALYGPGELSKLLQLGGLDDRAHILGFGVDTTFWAPGDDSRAGEVLAIGNDGRRDWSTLVEAAAVIAAPVRILTRHRPPAALPDNVTWHEADWHRQLLSDAEVREAYRRASVVVIPLLDSIQPSGQSVTLQAMGCGAPVILSRTRGLWDTQRLHDGENVVHVTPGDVDGLARAIGGLLSDPLRASAVGRAGRAYVAAHARVDQFAERLLEICVAAVARP